MERMELDLNKLRQMSAAAARIDRMRIDRARKLCVAAGLDGSLLGIHPHNAMVSWHEGKPWSGVNYSLVRACMRVMSMPTASAVVDRWYRRMMLAQRGGA